MKKIQSLYLVIILLSIFLEPTHAQQPVEKGLNSISKHSAQAYVGFLASDAMQGREAGTNSGRIAAEYVKSVLQDVGIKPFVGSYSQPFEAYSRERQKRGRFSVNPDSINVFKSQRAYRKLDLQNILGYIEGKNKEEYVVVGAHFDHVGMDQFLVGDKIYNGADDNASGISAVLQLAKAFMATRLQPQRSIIFALWDGEELGTLGSEYFMLNFPNPKSIKSCLNFDMIGRNNDEANPKHVVYFYTESHPEFGQWLKDDIEKYKLGLTPNYRPWDKPIGGSDNSSFAKREIPIIWYHTDGHPDYHQPTDEVDKINWDKLVDITKASFLNLWRMANENN